VAHYLVLTNQAEAKAAEAGSGATATPAEPAINSAATAADAAPGEPAGKKIPSSICHWNEASVAAW